MDHRWGSPEVVFSCVRPPVTTSGNAVSHAVFGPDSESCALNLLTTSTLYHPLPFGLVVGPSSLIVGAVLSTLKGAESTEAAVLPASSVHGLELTFTAVPCPEVVVVCSRPAGTTSG